MTGKSREKVAGIVTTLLARQQKADGSMLGRIGQFISSVKRQDWHQETQYPTGWYRGNHSVSYKMGSGGTHKVAYTMCIGGTLPVSYTMGIGGTLPVSSTMGIVGILSVSYTMCIGGTHRVSYTMCIGGTLPVF